MTGGSGGSKVSSSDYCVYSAMHEVIGPAELFSVNVNVLLNQHGPGIGKIFRSNGDLVCLEFRTCTSQLNYVCAENLR